jgi:hypothetical protein
MQKKREKARRCAEREREREREREGVRPKRMVGAVARVQTDFAIVYFSGNYILP